MRRVWRLEEQAPGSGEAGGQRRPSWWRSRPDQAVIGSVQGNMEQGNMYNDSCNTDALHDRESNIAKISKQNEVLKTEAAPPLFDGGGSRAGVPAFGFHRLRRAELNLGFHPTRPPVATNRSSGLHKQLGMATARPGFDV